uniref:Uncharacterized protein n=1 Tax=Arundo donax TaxID=35708 RepID=A0A0A8YXA9_ARUDO
MPFKTELGYCCNYGRYQNWGVLLMTRRNNEAFRCVQHKGKQEAALFQTTYYFPRSHVCPVQR